MKLANSSELYETISHTTASAPYSIHYTHVPPDFNPALYLHWHTEMEFFCLPRENSVFTLKTKPIRFMPGNASLFRPACYIMPTIPAPLRFPSMPSCSPRISFSPPLIHACITPTSCQSCTITFRLPLPCRILSTGRATFSIGYGLFLPPQNRMSSISAVYPFCYGAAYTGAIL